MRVAVVTPYSTECDENLRRAHESVQAQEHPSTHIMVADGAPRSVIDEWQVEHVILGVRHGDGGCTPRAAGAISAFARGFDAVAFLDADNSYDPDHIRSLVEAATLTGADLVFSDRRIELPDGTECPFEDKDVVERTHADTSCHFLTTRASFLAAAWGGMGPLWPLCDRLIVAVARRLGLSIAWTGHRTLRYVSRWGLHYKAVARTPPADEHRLDWGSISRRFDRGELGPRGFIVSNDDLRVVLQSLHSGVDQDSYDIWDRLVPIVQS